MADCWPLQLPASQKAVLISLADQANDEGVTWPSVGTIAQRVCLSERAVQTSIRSLEERGLLRVKERDRGNGSSTSNLYAIDMQACRALVGGVQDLRGGVKNLREGGAAAAPPEPSIEPSGEPPPNPPRGADAIKDEGQEHCQALTLSAWLEQCEANGEKAIPDDDPLHRWASKWGMSHDLIELHWSEFKRQWCGSNQTKTNWRREFLFAVQMNRYGLWTSRAQGGPAVPTDKARQALPVAEVEAARNCPAAPRFQGPPGGLE